MRTNTRIVTLLFCITTLLAVSTVRAIEIKRVEPSNWWAGMKNTELQIMVYGPNISKSKLAIKYPGITIKEVAQTTNPNYLFVYISIAKTTKPGMVPMQFTDGTEKFTYNYSLLPRTDKS